MAAVGLRSVVVAWLRVLLPLAALAVLSTLFLLSRHPEADRTIPYARVDAEARARDQQITAPTWSGVTQDGARVTLAADTAVPGPEGGIAGARALHLDWRTKDGLRATLDAPEAALGDDAITLKGGVAIQTSTGWTLDAPTVSAATDLARIEASGGVEAKAPFGAIRADAASLRPADDAAPGEGQGAPQSHLLDFTGGVRLVYRP